MNLHRKYQAIILAAGRSQRFGRPKFSLKYDSHNTFLEKVVNTFVQYGCPRVVVVLNDTTAGDLEGSGMTLPCETVIAINHRPEKARFLSLLTGVRALEQETDVFVTNIDNPFVTDGVLRSLSGYAGNYDYIYPVFEGAGGHPILISSKVIRGVMEEQNRDIHLKDFLNRYSSRGVTVKDPRVLININTEEEYLKYFRI